MGVFHQLGHDSVNLLDEPNLNSYEGAIVSPVDYTEAQVRDQIQRYQGEQFEIIFDPQLYFPKSARRHLPNWSHYPDDVDTADLGSEAWWSERVADLAAVMKRLRPAAVCSPAIAPRTYGAGYYSLTVNVANRLRDALDATGIEVLPTVLATMRDVASVQKVMELASIVTQTEARRAYLIFAADLEPRREVFEHEDLAGAMRLIKALEDSGIEVLVGFCSSEMILWKAAGASACATGKFFNLRRFTPSRFEPPAGGGGQLPYWFEESILAFLREPDVLRLWQLGKLSSNTSDNPFSAAILDKLTGDEEAAWLAESWRQYMYWFADAEFQIRSGLVTTDALLREAANNWSFLNGQGVILEEPANNGHWVGRWRQALSAFAG